MTITTSKQECIKSTFSRLYKTQIEWRRHLHQHPEIAHEEYETTSYLARIARQLGLKSLPLRMKTGLLVELRGKGEGPTVAIRSDIDALPINEQTGLRFKSQVDGRMHACGHDIHMATVLGTAALLAEMREQIRGNVRFIFQPAEEVPPGGAMPMIENGAIDGVSMIFGLHVDPHLPTGKISVLDGPAMASVFDFDIIIIGRGGHVARPHKAIDAIVTAAEVVESIQKITAREIDPITPAVISFGRIKGGNARNVVADRVELAGTARVMTDKMYRRIPALIKRTVAGICRARGAKYEFRPIASYPVLSNDPQVNRIYERNFTALFGKGRIVPTEKVLGSEDFACYLQKVPGAMFRLGVMNKKIRADKPWHSSEFIADEAAMEIGTTLLAACVLDSLDYITV